MSNNYILYSDPNPYKPTKKSILYNIESIYQSILNILSTPVGTRLFNRKFGCDFTSINFDLLDSVTVELARYIILNAIQDFEPRVTITSGSIYPDSENHVLNVYLVFQVLGFTGQNFTLSANIQR